MTVESGDSALRTTHGLADDEELVSVAPAPLRMPEERRTALDVLLEMASVDHPADLGMHGPLQASRANPENRGNAEIRRYEAVFGRDALYAAEFLGEAFPELEARTVRYLAGFQALRRDPSKQAEYGKIANHIRLPQDPLAIRLTRETGRRWPWYGATDTTVQFIAAAGRVLTKGLVPVDDVVCLPKASGWPASIPWPHEGRGRTLGDAVVAASEWLCQSLDRRPESGLLWAGLNDRDSFTVWTDSPNAFATPAGRIPRPPIAPLQLQGQAYDALLALASLSARFPELRLDGADMTQRADRLKARVLQHFVVEGCEPWLAAAAERLGGRTLPMASMTVSGACVLASGLLDEDRDASLRMGIVRRIFAPSMSSFFGLVGRDRSEAKFQVYDYHSQVWGFACHLVARGLVRHGLPVLAQELDARLLRQTKHGLFPENVGGGTGQDLTYCPHVLRVRRRAPDGKWTVTVKERPPAPYAAWTAAAVHAIESTNAVAASGPEQTIETEILAASPGSHRAIVGL